MAKAKKKRVAPVDRRSLFVLEYLKDRNATQAAIRAGYSPKGADVAGARLLVNVRVAQAISEAAAKVAESLQLSTKTVLAETLAIATSDLAHIIGKDFATLPPEIRRTVASIKVSDDGKVIEFKLWSKDRALENLMKHLGLIKPQDAGTGNVNIEQVLFYMPKSGREGDGT